MLRRNGLPAIKQNANHRTPKMIAARTSVKRCAPKAMRLNPTKATSNAALKITNVRQWRFQHRHAKKQELSVKQSGSDGVATGKTVTRPIYEGTVDKRARCRWTTSLSRSFSSMPPGTAMINVTKDGHDRFHTKNNTSANRTIPIHSLKPNSVNARNTLTKLGVSRS